MIRRLRAQAPTRPAPDGTRIGRTPVATSSTSSSVTGSWSQTEPRSACRTCFAAFTTSPSIVIRSNGAASAFVTPRIARRSRIESGRWRVRTVTCVPPRLRPHSKVRPLRCPPRGSYSRLGAARRRSSVCPHACGLTRKFGRCAAPRGGAIRALGRPGGAHVCPHFISARREHRGEKRSNGADLLRHH